MNIRPLISGILSLALIMTGMPARAGMVSTSETLSAEARSSRIAEVESFLTRDEVRNRMEAFGVDADQAASRVASLSDAELQQLSLNIQTLPAGGDGLGLVLVVLLILVVLEVVGAINIFSRI